jgi:serine protease Do
MRGFGEIAERLRRSTVQVFPKGREGAREGGGSGVIWDAGGRIITNSHVARTAYADIVLWDGRRLSARLVARDTRRDLAELRLAEGGLWAATSGSGAFRSGGADLPATASGSGAFRSGEGDLPAATSRSDAFLPGGAGLPAATPGTDAFRSTQGERRVAASGSGAFRPGGADLPAAAKGDSDALRPGELVIAIGSPLGLAGALSTGTVHSVGPIPGMGRARWIGATVRLAPGNSGGPLADAQGRVVGINTAIVNGLGVAVPANDAAEFLRRGARPSLGVTLRPEPHGLRILAVDPGGAAAAASLRPGDILVGTFDQLTGMLDSGRDTLRLPFFRGDTARLREVYVRVAPRAEAA